MIRKRAATQQGTWRMVFLDTKYTKPSKIVLQPQGRPLPQGDYFPCPLAPFATASIRPTPLSSGRTCYLRVLDYSSTAELQYPTAWRLENSGEYMAWGGRPYRVGQCADHHLSGAQSEHTSRRRSSACSGRSARGAMCENIWCTTRYPGNGLRGVLLLRLHVRQ